MSDLIKKAITAKRESKYIEFKLEFNPDSAKDWCEIIKDIVAIANSGGGIIIFGLDNDGKPSKRSVEKVIRLDPADITNKVAKYTGSTDVEFEIIKLKKNRYDLVGFLIKGSSIPLVFEKPGTYDIGSGKQSTAFSVGTVYFRHGSKSEPGSSNDIRLVIDRQLESIRKSWIKGVKKVVQAPKGAQIIAVQSGKNQKRVALSHNVRAVNDPKATPVLLTRDSTISTGTFIHEEVSNGIFDEINNVIDANRALAKGTQSFFFGQPVYYRIYAERQHVNQATNDIGLLIHSAVMRFYAPAIFWMLKAPEKFVTESVTKLYLQPKTPYIHTLMGIAILLGEDFCKTIYDKWNSKWGRHSQPPSFYWTFKDMIAKSKNTDPRVVASKTTLKSVIEIKEQGSFAVKELLNKPEKAANLLSKVCMLIFEGENSLRSTARCLDYLAYGAAISSRSKKISKEIMKKIGDREIGDFLESQEKE